MLYVELTLVICGVRTSTLVTGVTVIYVAQRLRKEIFGEI